MDPWQGVAIFVSSSVLAALVSGIVTTIVARGTLRQQQAALGQQRLTDTTRLMLDLMATAHGAPVDGRTGIGVGQQLAAIEMIATIGTENPLFSGTAVTFLDDLVREITARPTRSGEQWHRLKAAAEAGRDRAHGSL